MRFAWAVAYVSLVVGYANNPGQPRFFRPVTRAAGQVALAASDAVSIRLRPAKATKHLDQRIVWQMSAAELGYYELERWTEPPQEYVTRALRRELFDSGAFRRQESASADYSLEVELIALEEVLLPDHKASLELSLVLLDREQRACIERTIRLEHPVAEERVESLAESVGSLLDELASQVGEVVREAVSD